MQEPEIESTGRFAYDGLDRLIHEKARLGILTSLIREVGAPLSFNDLKDRCSLTDGNLSRHLNLLVEGGLVRIEKCSRNNRPWTVVHLTELGRIKFHEYLNILEMVIRDAAPTGVTSMPDAPRPAVAG